MRVLCLTLCYRTEPETVDAVFRMQPVGPMDILFTRDQPTGDGYKDVLHNYRKGRDAFLAGDYDALFVVESDIIPPTDALVKMAAVDADVVLGYYLLRRGNSARPNVSIGFNVIEDHWQTDQTVPVSGDGLGCALIYRRVLESIPFRLAPNVHCDTPFHEDVQRSGFTTMVHLGVRCGHKRPDGRILWPDLENGMKVSIGQVSNWHMAEAEREPDK